jgi:hypothetical protein
MYLPGSACRTGKGQAEPIPTAPTTHVCVYVSNESGGDGFAHHVPVPGSLTTHRFLVVISSNTWCAPPVLFPGVPASGRPRLLEPEPVPVASGIAVSGEEEGTHEGGPWWPWAGVMTREPSSLWPRTASLAVGGECVAGRRPGRCCVVRRRPSRCCAVRRRHDHGRASALCAAVLAVVGEFLTSRRRGRRCGRAPSS